MGYIPAPPPMPEYYANTHASAMTPRAFGIRMQHVEDWLAANSAAVTLQAVICPQCGAPLENALECHHCGSRFSLTANKAAQ